MASKISDQQDEISEINRISVIKLVSMNMKNIEKVETIVVDIKEEKVDIERKKKELESLNYKVLNNAKKLNKKNLIYIQCHTRCDPEIH